MYPNIKICGVTREQDALLAQELGAAALGLNFFAHSPRCISIERAREITAAVGGLAHTVAVMVNPDVAQVEQVIQAVNVNTLQFHGNEPPGFCEQFNYPYFKAIRVKPDQKLEEVIAPYSSARGVLLDTFVKGEFGGTGKRFDWSLTAVLNDPRIIVAGGLRPENIAEAVQTSRARAFDVASGVESAPGVKDHQKLRDLFNALRCEQV